MIKGSDPKSIYVVQSAIQDIILNSYGYAIEDRTPSGKIFKTRSASTGTCSTCPFGSRLTKTFFVKEPILGSSPSCYSLYNYRKRSNDKYLASHCSHELINRIVLFLLNDPSIEVVSNIRKKKNADKK